MPNAANNGALSSAFVPLDASARWLCSGEEFMTNEEVFGKISKIHWKMESLKEGGRSTRTG